MLFRLPEIVLNLLIHPTFGRGVKGDGQPHRHLRRDSSPSMNEIGEGGATYAKGSGSFGHTQAQWFETQFLQHFPWMRWVVHPRIVELPSGSLHSKHP